MHISQYELSSTNAYGAVQVHVYGLTEANGRLTSSRKFCHYNFCSCDFFIMSGKYFSDNVLSQQQTQVCFISDHNSFPAHLPSTSLI